MCFFLDVLDKVISMIRCYQQNCSVSMPASMLKLVVILFFVLLSAAALGGSKPEPIANEHAERKLASEDKIGFISIDCGSSIPYTDVQTGIDYVSDTNYISSGVSKTVSSEYDTDTLDRHLFTLRSFPKGVRNCYTLQPAQGKENRYLIRARFLHGNYDNETTLPVFHLYLGANLWDSVSFDSTATILTKEIIHIPYADDVSVCLVNKGSGTPFISSLELRFLKNSTYRTPYQSLALYTRLDLGSTSNKTIRYKDDVYDRFWTPYNFGETHPVSTNLTIDSRGSNDFHPPSSVMASAAISENITDDLDFHWEPDASTALSYIYLHFTEVLLLNANQTREFNMSANGNFFYGPVVPDYLYTTTVYGTTALSGDSIQFSIYKTERSTLPPILSAIEIYIVTDSSQQETNQQDAKAIMDIKSTYGVERIWQGDPCAPQGYSWDGVTCNFNGTDPPTITSLDLSSSGLSGEIASSFSKLGSLQHLDLSNNNLTGTVPAILSELPLTVLNLEGNNLTGSLPSKLIEKSQNGLLSLSVDPELCASESCGEEVKTSNRKSFVIPMVAPVAAVLILFLAAIVIAWSIKRKRKQAFGKVDLGSKNYSGSLESKKRHFTYAEVLSITNNFERILGKGGFGTVYHGSLPDGIQVAVKMLSELSAQGYQQFHAEVKLLMRVHHRNLTALIGYCNEGTKMGLIYEYMVNGNLERHLSEKNSYVLSWEDRVRIAMDSAQGLEYLHTGCKPPIVHRDIKSTNILLNERFQAKLADFGLSRIFPVEGGTRTHVSTVVAGTPGYLDPEYYVSNWLNEKSDVFSFGVVLMEIITSRPVIIKADENVHIRNWLDSMVQNGDINKIVDPRLRGNFDANSAWKAVEIAMTCVSATSAGRPTMNEVTASLKECLEAEMTRLKYSTQTDQSKDSLELITRNLDTELSPLAR